ncbi:MAG: hypothetical protein IPG89_18220 [Bacteroidetes bacterium]|nr:hypothetical protein [Bacteroidota bacterium]
MTKAKDKTSRQGVTKNTGYIISNPTYTSENDNLQLLRITVTNLETKIDFGYQATDYYTNGGWIDISPNTFHSTKRNKQKIHFK